MRKALFCKQVMCFKVVKKENKKTSFGFRKGIINQSNCENCHGFWYDF